MFYHLVSDVQAFKDALSRAGLRDPVVVQLSGEDSERLRAIADKYVHYDRGAGAEISSITLAGVTFVLDGCSASRAGGHPAQGDRG